MELDPKVTEVLSHIGIKITKEHDDYVIFQNGAEIFSSPCEQNLMIKLRRIVQTMSQDCVDLMKDLDPERYQQFVEVAQRAAGWVMQGLFHGDVYLALQAAAIEFYTERFPQSSITAEDTGVIALMDGAWAVIRSWGKELP